MPRAPLPLSGFISAVGSEGIHSVGELVSRSEADLMDIRNFGSKSIEEVKDKLRSLGLMLKDSPAGFVPAFVDEEDGDFAEDEQL